MSEDVGSSYDMIGSDMIAWLKVEHEIDDSMIR